MLVLERGWPSRAPRPRRSSSPARWWWAISGWTSPAPGARGGGTAPQGRGAALRLARGLKLKGRIDASGWTCAGRLPRTSARAPAASPTACCRRARSRVHAIDVGYGQLHEKLRKDPRVRSPGAGERALPHRRGAARAGGRGGHRRELHLAHAGAARGAAVPGARRAAGRAGEAAVRGGPGADRQGRRGARRRSRARRPSTRSVAFAREQGLTVRGVMDSPVPGPAGNVEALLVADRP